MDAAGLGRLDRVFGLVSSLQFGYIRGCISRNAGFLDTRIDASFYMYCGCVSGANANSKEATVTTLAISYVSFAALVRGHLELCAS